MTRNMPVALFSLIFAANIVLNVQPLSGKEFLTEKEIRKVQDNYQIDARVKVYLEAAALRLKVAEERLTGKESAPGDPLEFFTPEEMLDGYYRIMKSVEYNLDDAANMNAASMEKERKLAESGGGKPSGPRSQLIGKALKHLKSETEKNAAQLEILKKIAEEKRKEELWDLVNQAIDITQEAHEGAEYGLSKHPAPPEKEKKKK